MRPVLILAASLLVLAASCSGSGTAKDISIDLRIDVWPNGKGAGNPVKHWRLQCNPLGGNLPHGDRACYMLAALPQPFAPVPPETACTQVYGGPEFAHVVGSRRGRRVDAGFRRTDGCEIARWERLKFLFPERP